MSYTNSLKRASNSFFLMKSLPCPRCGDPKTIGTFCASCQRELHPLVEKVKESTITLCIMSGRIKIGTGWETISLEEAVQKVAEHAMVAKERVSKIFAHEFEVDDLFKPGLERQVVVRVSVTGHAQGLPEYTEDYELPLTIKTTVSPRYAKIGTQYFEGVLQLRNEHLAAKKLLHKLVGMRDGLAINKEIAHKRGTDYQFTNKQSMRQIAHELFARFGGLLKENARLITYDKQRSKDVHRLTVFIEFPPFMRGDVLISDEELVYVQGLGKKLRLQNLRLGKVREEAYEPDKYEVISPVKTTVSQVEPEIAIINPETFQQEKLFFHTKGGTPTFVVGDEVFVVWFKDKWWLTPVRSSEPKK